MRIAHSVLEARSRLMQSLSVDVGNFFFRYRNLVFPVLVAGLFAMAIPPAELFGSEALEHCKDGLAILVAASGLTLRGLVIGYEHVRRAGAGRNIHAAKLFTTGMFSLCRNPLYTGNILIFVGIFLMHGNPWTVVLGSASYILIYHAIVRAEEDYLSRTFDEPYAEYCREVPRWLPRLDRFGQATAGMTFNPRRVLLVEYPNIGITVIALALAELYEEIEEPLMIRDTAYIRLLAGIVVLGIVWVGAMRFVKKRRLIVAG